MSQLTPAFKLTLLLSVGAHLATFIQTGGTSPGYHTQTLNTRFSVTLSSSKNVEKVNTDEPAPEQTIPPVRAASKPARKQVAEEPPEPFKPSRFELTEQTADVHASQPKQTAGQAQNGLLAEEDYREQLLRHLEKFKHYPFVARRQGLQGAVKMQITVNRQGKLLSVNCLSGGAMFCHAAVKSARDAEPLPDPPQSPYRLEYVMEYKLHQ